MTRMERIIKDIDNYLENYEEGVNPLHVELSAGEKKLVENYLSMHPVGKDFRMLNGVLRHSTLEKSFYIRHVSDIKN